MRNPDFRNNQWEHRFDPHMAPINRLVDKLRREPGGWVPYVAPLYGGVNSKVLFVLQNPGPGTDDRAQGSGFLCPQNDDPTAELFADCLEAEKLSVNRIMSWNAYPWKLPLDQKRPNARQLEAGIEPIRKLLSLVLRLKVVILMGRVAEDGWRRYVSRYPEAADQYKVMLSPHPSRQGIVGGGKHSKSEGIAKVRKVIRLARSAIA